MVLVGPPLDSLGVDQWLIMYDTDLLQRRNVVKRGGRWWLGKRISYLNNCAVMNYEICFNGTN